MRQAIWNLCLNAVQAMPDGGEMRVGGQALGEPEREQIQIWVADSGHGIADADLPHIFEPFYSTKAGAAGSAWPSSIASCRTTAASSRRAAGRGRGRPSP